MYKWQIVFSCPQKNLCFYKATATKKDVIIIIYRENHLPRGGLSGPEEGGGGGGGAKAPTVPPTHEINPADGLGKIFIQ